MDIYQLIEFFKFLFLGVFLGLFLLEKVTKKSYKIYYSIAITLAVIFASLLWTWPLWLRAGFVALFIWVTMRIIVTERLGNAEHDEAN